MLIITNKNRKNQAKRDIESIINNISLQIMSDDLNHQSATMSKEQWNPVLIAYATPLQKEVEIGPEMGNIIIPRTNKR